MKKTLFSALAVVSIVTAALAFSPVKQNADIYTNDETTGMCTFKTDYKEDAGGSTQLSGPFSKTPNPSAGCPQNIFQATLDQ